jgi:hypothetical protein
VITEVMANPSGADAHREWFELHNPGDLPVELSGAVLTVARADGSGAELGLLDGLTVEPGAHLVLGGAAAESLPPHADHGYGPDLALRNSGGGLLELSRCGVSIDVAVYPEPSDGVALQLAGAPDPATNDDPQRWCEATEPYGEGDLGSPGEPNPPCVVDGYCLEGGVLRPALGPAPGEVVVTEILADPLGADGGLEWFEVRVAAGVDLNGLLAGVDVTELDALIDDPDCQRSELPTRRVFAQTADPDSNGGLPGVDGSFGFSLGNGSGRLVLAFGDILLDAVEWTGSSAGIASSLDPDFESEAGNDDEGHWCEATEPYGDAGQLGSPGSANLPCAIEGLCFDGSLRRAALPPAGDEVVITEVLPNPSGANGDKQWFELRVDPGAGHLDLNGLELGVVAGTVDAVLNHRDCLTVSGGPAHLIFAQSVDPARNGGLALVHHALDRSLPVTGGSLFVGHGGTVLDQVWWTSPPAGASLAVDPDFQSASANDDGGSWCVGEAPYGTNGDRGSPGVANPYCQLEGLCFDGPSRRAPVPPAPGQVVISEVLANPTGADAGKEWFELAVDPQGGSVDLNGLQIGRAQAFPLETWSELDCLSFDRPLRLLFAQGVDPLLNGGLPTPDQLFGFSLNNATGSLAVGFGGLPHDAVSWTSATTGVAWSRDPGGRWCEALAPYGDGDLGTPRGANPLCP